LHRRNPVQLTASAKGTVEATIRYVKHNALQGRAEQLTTWPDYPRLAVHWRDEVANVRLHQATGECPVNRFEQERPYLRALPNLPFDTDEIVATVVDSHARVRFDGNRYSVPPDVMGKPVTIRAGAETVRVVHEGHEIPGGNDQNWLASADRPHSVLNIVFDQHSPGVTRQQFGGRASQLIRQQQGRFLMSQLN